MDLCGSWPPLPLTHVCVTLSVERPDTTSCEVVAGRLCRNVGHRKRKRTRPGLSERKEGTKHNISSLSPSLISKQLSSLQNFKRKEKNKTSSSEWCQCTVNCTPQATTIIWHIEQKGCVRGK